MLLLLIPALWSTNMSANHTGNWAERTPPTYSDSFYSVSERVDLDKDVLWVEKVAVNAASRSSLVRRESAYGYDARLYRADLQKVFMVASRGASVECFSFPDNGVEDLPSINFTGAKFIGNATVDGRAAEHFRLDVGTVKRIGIYVDRTDARAPLQISEERFTSRYLNFSQGLPADSHFEVPSACTNAKALSIQERGAYDQDWEIGRL